MLIDIDFNNPLDQVRAMVGDPSSEFISDNAINSALVKTNNDVTKAALLVMDLMVNTLCLLADREREGQVEIYYTKAFERYSKIYDNLKKESKFKLSAGIYINGTSKSNKESIRKLTDKFSAYDMADWHNKSLSNKTIYELLIEDQMYMWE
jgi:hypothetical protein